MPIIYCEKLRTNAIFFDVERDTDPIFIVVPRYSCVGVDGVCFYHSVLFN